MKDLTEKSIAELTLAAEQGDAGAQYQLAEIYAEESEGEEDEESEKEAAKWYRKAAEQGDADGQYGLGCCYAEGKGIQQNKQEAIYWLSKAAEQENEEAADRLNELNSPSVGSFFKRLFGL